MKRESKQIQANESHLKSGVRIPVLLLWMALLGLVFQDIAVGQGPRGGGGGPRGGGGGVGAGFRGGPGGGAGLGGGPGGGQGGGQGQGMQRGPGGGQRGNGNMAGQQGGGGNGECMMGQGGSGGSGGSFQSMVQAAMGLDANQDGVLTVNEVPDPRMQGMMSVADTDADGVVTQQEFARMVQFRMGVRGGQGGGVGGGPGSDEMIPGVLRNQNELELSEEQQSRLAELQISVEKRILGILTKEQRSRYQKMKQSGAGTGGGASVSAGSGRPQKQSVKATTGS